jgi:hypothetical protein
VTELQVASWVAPVGVSFPDGDPHHQRDSALDPGSQDKQY